MVQEVHSANFREKLKQLKDEVAGLEEELSGLRRNIDKLAPKGRKETKVRKKRYAVVNAGRCTGCRMREQVCPAGAIKVTYVAQVDTDRCTGCGICVQYCAQGAISLRES